MAATAGNAAAEAARLAIEMGSAAVDLVSFMACLGEELPVMNSALKTLKTIRVTVESVRSHMEEIEVLENRCTYMTACFIIKCRQNPSSTMVVTPLEDCMEEVENFTRRCSRRGKLSRVLKASSDKDEIAELNARLNRLTGDLGLAGIATLEGKIDGMTAILERMGKNQDAVVAHIERTAPKLANVPKGTPTRKSWHVERHHVVGTVLEAFNREGGARLVGLVGRSGAGKTTAASESVRSTKVQEAFSDGMVWLPVNKFAKDRLPSLLLHLARTVYEDIAHSVGDPPSASDDGAAYIKQLLGRGRGGSELKCLLVADNVWEEEVVSKLLETGMWVLLTTRAQGLVTRENGHVVGVDELSHSDAQSVLRKAAELPTDARLPDDAIDLINLCGHVAMDLAFVGRWSVVRGRQDRTAWSEAAGRIRHELGKIGGGTSADATVHARVTRRKAILRAGFEDLGIGSDDERVQKLYLSLGVLPDGHALTKKDAATLLYDHIASVDDEVSAGGVLDTLERWAVLRCEDGLYRMHDSHSGFARESLEDHGGVRKRALKRWRAHISSLETLRSTDESVLKRLWLAVEDIGGEGWAKTRPYVKALDGMVESHPLFRGTVEAVGEFQETQEDWNGARAMWCRLLNVEKRHLGDHHPYVLNTYRCLARCAERLGDADEAAEWLQMERDGLPLALAKFHERIADDGVNGLEDANALTSLASTMSELTLGDGDGAETLLRRSLSMKEAALGPEDAELCFTLYVLGACVREAGRLDEAEDLLRRCLAIEEIKLGPQDAHVALTLNRLAMVIQQAGRQDEAEPLLRRCLAIETAKPSLDNSLLARALCRLALCVRESQRLDEAEQLLKRCLAIQEADLGSDSVGVSYILHELGVCARTAGRLDEAEKLWQRCLTIQEAKLGPEHKQVAVTLQVLGVCFRERGRLEESETLLRRDLSILEVNVGHNEITVSYALHELSRCVRSAGRPNEAEELLRRCLSIEEANLGPDHVSMADTLHQLGVLARTGHRVEEARQLMRRCLTIQEAKLGPQNAQTAVTLYELVLCAREEGKLGEEEQLLRRCLTIQEVQLGLEDVRVGYTLHELGVCVREAGRLDEAEGLLMRCLTIKEARLDPADVQIAVTLQELCLCVRLVGRLDAAEELMRRCLAIQETTLGSEDLQVAGTLYRLGSWAREGRHLDDAVRFLRRCLAIEEANFGPGDAQTTITLYALGVCLREIGKLDEAQELLRRCLAIEQASVGPNDAEVAATLYQLGACVQETGRLDEAEELLGRCIASHEAKEEKQSADMAMALRSLGVCVRDSGRFDEAEEILSRCLVIDKAEPGADDLTVAITLHELGVCARGAGHKADAADSFRNCLEIVEVKLNQEDVKRANSSRHRLGDSTQIQEERSANLADELEQAKSLSLQYFEIEEVDADREVTGADQLLQDLGKCLTQASRLR
ncbi:unnamed protein product [Scytosiphon promiscuus]